MTAKLKRGILRAYRGFSSPPSTLIAQLFIVALLGVVTLAGMSGIARHERQTMSAESE